jgi:hypothetical protein
MNNDDQSIAVIIEEFKRGGWVVAILGGLGALARLILTNEDYKFWIWFRKILAGTIVGTIAYFALYFADIEPLYKSIIFAVSGSIAPELFDMIRLKLKTTK